MDEKHLSKNLTALLNALVILARDRIVKDGTFDPFGAVLTADNKIMFVETGIILDEPRKGLSANQLLRAVEDGIRAIRRTNELACAAIFYDANLRPLEGGDPESALVGRFEEKGGSAMQILIPYVAREGRIDLGTRQIIQKRHHLIPTGAPSEKQDDG